MAETSEARASVATEYDMDVVRGFALSALLWGTVGMLVGQGLGLLIFHYVEHPRLPESRDNLVALGIPLIAYGLTELAHGYGFLAVFVAALTRLHHEQTRRQKKNGDRVE